MDKPMTKHTPGPWTVVGGSEVRSGARIVCITDAYGRHDDQLEPDARLIAKAPEMLDALRELADCTGFIVPPKHVEYMALRARAILNELEG